jgi:hypothetical protein
MELLREGKAVKQIRFTFNASPLVLEPSATKLPLAVASQQPEPEAWVNELLMQGVGEAGCDVIRRHLAEGQYPVAYISYVLGVMRRPRKAKIRKPADYLYKCITGKLLLEEFYRSQEPIPTPAKSVRKTSSRAIAAVAAETVYQVEEVREMYDNPGPFSKRNARASTFEEHLQQIYLSQGFVLEKRAGKSVLVLKS